MSKNKKNNSGDDINITLSNWSFKGNVYKKFDNHINKSVPLYNETHDLYLKLTDFFLQDNSKIIDIGCSTGVFLSKVHNRHRLNYKKIKFEGIDTISQMIKYCKKKNKKKKNISFHKQDVFKKKLDNSCIISSFYTIQFISPKKRQALIDKIYKSLNWGGAFFMVEKVRGPDARFQDILNFLYFDFKQESGLSPVNILNKEISLRSVLEPYTIDANMGFLKRAGFKDIMPIAQYLCFKGFLAIK